MYIHHGMELRSESKLNLCDTHKVQKSVSHSFKYAYRIRLHMIPNLIPENSKMPEKTLNLGAVHRSFLTNFVPHTQ